jgi:hypothetical protein
MAIQRGEIYLVDLNPVQGRRQAGRRPVLVLSVDAINRLPFTWLRRDDDVRADCHWSYRGAGAALLALLAGSLERGTVGRGRQGEPLCPARSKGGQR